VRKSVGKRQLGRHGRRGQRQIYLKIRWDVSLNPFMFPGARKIGELWKTTKMEKRVQQNAGISSLDKKILPTGEELCCEFSVVFSTLD
jgi:hypothetical protein